MALLVAALWTERLGHAWVRSCCSGASVHPAQLSLSSPAGGKDVLRCGDPSAPSQSKTGSVEDGKGETQADCAHPLTFGECS